LDVRWGFEPRQCFVDEPLDRKVSPTATMDHNICLTIAGTCQIAADENGTTRIVYKPGEYGDHNIIDRRGAAGMFVRFDPSDSGSVCEVVADRHWVARL
jgi:hypothetical protein